MLQLLPLSHGPQLGPPQSVADSPWFCALSVQVGVLQLPPVQIWLSQSLLVAHLADGLHGAHGPPQSVSLSPLPTTPSAQPSLTHTWFWQRLL
jgi:hypothetical protein